MNCPRAPLYGLPLSPTTKAAVLLVHEIAGISSIIIIANGVPEDRAHPLPEAPSATAALDDNLTTGAMTAST